VRLPNTSDPSTLDSRLATSIHSYRVLCKGCNATLPLPLFLHPIDASSYRVRVQCKRCVAKSAKHWRAHREDIKAARATRERDSERITCVCGTSINVRHRTKHCQSKRHLSVVAVLRQHNALSTHTSACIDTAPAPAAEQEGCTPQEEFDEVIAAIEQELARERRRSLPQLPHSSTVLVATTEATAPTIDGLVGEQHRTAEHGMLPANATTAGAVE
jgi:hypothetical protein